MRKRFSTILLAAGLMTAALSGSAYAAGTDQTEAASESAAVEAAAQLAATEAEAAEELEAVEEEVAGTEAEAAQTGGTAMTTADLKEPANVSGPGVYADYYALYEQQIEKVLLGLSQMSEEKIDAAIKAKADGSVIIATWDSVREDLGLFEAVTSYDVAEADNELTYTLDAVYQDAEAVGSKVKVNYTIDLTGKSEETVNWDVKETLARSVKKAAMNTLIGLGIVFIVLMFLTFLISQIHWIPDIMNASKKKEAPAPAPAPAPVAAPVVEETVDETDDLELVAVIAAAIAASEDVPADGFVVRSIRRRGRKSSWQNA